ncbi:MAG: EF-P beta-lysylation protein EpmB [Gammaproteobacteria bacterium]|jgi:EF-P beta-lysylation protein EpmB|nr:EF-P beta-lysylation protein EpmB [Gammaproteobacteria bacterium]MDP6653977.1 EF-P beta-lysylation protein EpmB [Gammaproteobacteria bacterium]
MNQLALSITKSDLPVIKSDLPEKWQQILSDLIIDPKELVQLLELDESLFPASAAALQNFPLKVPRTFAALMEKGNWNDPLLRQVWPFREEEKQHPEFVTDPLAETQYNPASGLLHKYRGRVLLTAVPHCAVHCRYCFRRHFDYSANSPSRSDWQQALGYIRLDESIEEVILSGGDPLAAPDRQLKWLMDQLNGISHINTLRIHTRFPVVIPQRITPELAALLWDSALQIVLVLHCNHAQELSPELVRNLSMLATNGIIILNQSILLREINDNSRILIDLSRALIAAKVLPYYLHLPDKVAGTRHYGTDAQTGCSLISEMQQCLPGYLVPKLVQEQAGAAAKTRLA